MLIVQRDEPELVLSLRFRYIFKYAGAAQHQPEVSSVNERQQVQAEQC